MCRLEDVIVACIYNNIVVYDYLSVMVLSLNRSERYYEKLFALEMKLVSSNEQFK